MKDTIAVIAVHAALVAAAFLTMAPLLWMVSASLMPAGESTTLPLRFLPSAPTLEHYRALFERMSLGRHLWSSTLVATSATVISLFLNSMAGYAFAKLHFAGRERIFQALLAALVIPAQVSMLPLFLLLKEMGIVNTYLAAIVPGMASIFGIFLVRQFAMAIPDTLLDAARIDGAGELRIYWSLVLPFCRPVLVTLAVFTFLGTWNDFLWPLIVLADDDLYTLPVALANLLGEHAQDTELMMAGAVLTVMPVLALFVALQRQYVAGIMAGALKE
jgi:multiple sugar transport system permease protein